MPESRVMVTRPDDLDSLAEVIAAGTILERGPRLDLDWNGELAVLGVDEGRAKGERLELAGADGLGTSRGLVFLEPGVVVVKLSCEPSVRRLLSDICWRMTLCRDSGICDHCPILAAFMSLEGTG